MNWQRPSARALVRYRNLASVAAFAGIVATARDAHACSGSETEVYRSQKSVWCVENSLIASNGAFPKEFFPYGDNVVDQLVALFDVPAEGIYTFEASVPTGGAHTGSECCNLGVTVTGDAFYGDAYGAKGFWGYLLSLHEMVNDFTGQVSGGWPTDFWADHVSAFPNSMDWHIMSALGTKDNDSNLTKASVSQKARFYPGGDSVDARVGMFDSIFDLPNYGFPGLSRLFGMLKSDKVSLDGLGVPNPDPKRTEYVIAYLSLIAGKPVTPIMKAAHVGDGTPSGHGDAGYVVKDSDIDAIASAHCSVVSAGAQGKNVSADATALRSGNYAGVKTTGTCGNGCKDECGCKSASNTCVPRWLADAVVEVPDAGGGTSTPPTGEGDASVDPGTGTGTGTSSGTGTNPGHPTTLGGVDAGASQPLGASDSSQDAVGVGCNVGPNGQGSTGSRTGSLFALTALVGLAFARIRRRR